MTTNKPFSKINILASHHFLKDSKHFLDLILALSPYANVMVDSGAFSALSTVVKGGDPVDLKSYIEFCKKYYHNHVWQYVQLDVIGNKRVTKNNLEAMYNAGLTPMPVFVVGEDYSRVYELTQQYQPRVCIAGGVKASDAFIHKRYQAAWKHSKGTLLAHGLGFLRFPDTFQLPIATGDSSTSSSGARFGQISVYNRRDGSKRVNWKDVLKDPIKHARIISFLKKCNVPGESINNPDFYRTHSGIPTLFEMYATLQQMQHSHDKKFGMFSAFATYGWVYGFLCILATADHDGFDYTESAKLHRHIRDLVANKPEKALEEAVSIVQRKTNYKNNVIDDEKQLEYLKSRYSKISIKNNKQK